MSPVFEVLVLLASWLGAGLITYGYMKAKTEDLEKRLEKVEAMQGHAVYRDEFESRITLLMQQLTRIEEKLDKYFMHQQSQQENS